MRSSTACCVALTLMLATGSVLATTTNNVHIHYKWKDAEGNIHFADALPPEAVQFGYDVISAQDIVIKHVDRARTPEELKAAEAEIRQQASARHEVEEQAKKDQQMLAAYPTEADLIRTQQAQLDMLDQAIHGTEIGMDSQEKSLTDLLSSAAEFDRNDKPVPAQLQQQIDSLRLSIEKQKAYIARKQQDKIDAAKNYVSELQRYRELNAKAQAEQ